VVVDHGGGVATLYAHCSELLVVVGQSVAQGELIARVGSTGWSTGPHLHIEFRIDGVVQDPYDFLR
jgi:murein DD-endopeptidase MepM/ murein hydrolase activator NlpD